jgi:enoyl-[acyl-carrier protein] reductase/trans-2-enoyl-CoA reductase (NAD+)
MDAEYVVKPRIKGFICTTAHPDGCAENVAEQINRAKPFHGLRSILVIGASTGYGLASRIAATFGGGAHSVGVFFERPAQGERTASAGWYNTVAFNAEIRRRSPKVQSININGDAFSDEIKKKTVEAIRENLGTVDAVVYSLASPRRTHPKTGETFRSVLKPIGQAFTQKTVNTDSGTVGNVTLEPATEDEIASTVAVMGGEDWLFWMKTLLDEHVLSKEVKTVAYSYIGPRLTWDIYRNGTIGRAKEDLERRVGEIAALLKPLGGSAFLSVNKAVVTQASSAIPVVPLYVSVLFKVMREKGLHEDCIDQINRLFTENLYGKGLNADEVGRIRLDDREMREDVQEAIREVWEKLTTENLHALTNFDLYQKKFLNLFGFGYENINYDKPANTDLQIGDIL